MRQIFSRQTLNKEGIEFLMLSEKIENQISPANAGQENWNGNMASYNFYTNRASKAHSSVSMILQKVLPSKASFYVFERKNRYKQIREKERRRGKKEEREKGR